MCAQMHVYKHVCAYNNYTLYVAKVSLVGAYVCVSSYTCMCACVYMYMVNVILAPRFSNQFNSLQHAQHQKLGVQGHIIGIYRASTSCSIQIKGEVNKMADTESA